jgi:hypothetical protein
MSNKYSYAMWVLITLYYEECMEGIEREERACLRRMDGVI